MIFRTLKNRLVAGYLVGGAIVSVAVVVFVGARMRHLLLQQLDHSLADKVRFVRSACVQGAEGVDVELGRNLFQRIHDPEDPEFIQLSLVGSGRVILESPTIREIEMPEIESSAGELGWRFVKLNDGRKLRLAGQIFEPDRKTDAGAPVKLKIIAAHDLKRIDEATRDIIVLSLQACGVSLVLLAILIRWIVRRNLEFFDVLGRRIGGLNFDADGVGAIHLQDAPREMLPVMNRLNDLIRRMERALKNERRFTANTAHELRTPLAGLRSRIELALSRPRSNEEYEDALVELLKIEEWLERLVQSLLLLARLEAGTQRIDY
ncbi:MAG: hypothetical protein KDB18_03225, partial [Salinibacterium sp.]|nr:hypothetical protein [Salinibacterium sp.]